MSAERRRRFGTPTAHDSASKPVTDSGDKRRIFTCTRDPHLRLLFVVIGLLLRNVWVWLHETLFAEGWGNSATLHPEKLRFRRMLDWIAFEVVAQLHDGSMPYVELAK